MRLCNGSISEATINLFTAANSGTIKSPYTLASTCYVNLMELQSISQGSGSLIEFRIISDLANRDLNQFITVLNDRDEEISVQRYPSIFGNNHFYLLSFLDTVILKYEGTQGADFAIHYSGTKNDAYV